MIPTERQRRDGRQLIGMSQEDSATAADVAPGLVTRAGAADGFPTMTGREASALRTALDAAGIASVLGIGAGVRLRTIEP